MALNSWVLNKSSLSVVYSQGSANPDIETLNVIAGEPVLHISNSLSSFTLEATVNESWLQVSPENLVYVPGSVQPFSITFLNLSSLSTGIYQAKIRFLLIGESLTLGSQLLGTKDFDVSIKVINTQAVNLNTDEIDLTYTKDSVLQEVTSFDITGVNWSVKYSEEFILSAPGITFFEDSTGKYILGTGEKTILISGTDELNSKDVGAYTYYLQVNQNTGSLTTNTIITVNVTVISISLFKYGPEEFNFTSVKNISEADTQSLKIISGENFTFEKPSWLNINPNSGQGYLEVELSVDSSNLDEGIYQGEIKIVRVIGFTTEKTALPVTLNVLNFVSIPYSSDELAFALNKDVLVFNTEYTNTYFQLKLVIRSYTFKKEEVYKEFDEKVALFQQKQVIRIGDKIQRFLQKLNYLEDLEVGQYWPTKLNILISERDLQTKEEIRKVDVNNLMFIGGFKPTHIIGNMAFLGKNPKLKRVTRKGSAHLNFTLPLGLYHIQKFVNGVFFSQEEFITGNDRLFTVVKNFQEHKVGDVVSFRIPSLSGTISQSFIIFPDTRKSNQIYWEGKSKLIESYEFTSFIKVPVDFEDKTNTLYDGFVEKLEKVDYDEKPRLTINTGHLPKSNIPIILDLIGSNRAWIKMGDIYLNLVPVQKGILAEDTLRQTINYTIEFRINPISYAQDYTF